jgi:hypothetical protein
MLSALALADNPTVRIRSADQARAVAALLRQSDFGAGWQGGQTKASALRAPSCPGFDPKQSDLVVSGHADARFTFPGEGAVVEQDVEVLASAAAVRKDFARTIRPQLPPCLAYELQHSANVVSAAVGKVPFPPTGAVSAAYRATVVVHRLRLRGVLVSDFVYFAKGRVEYLLEVSAPLGQQDQLGRFELALAQILLKRAAGAQA